MRPVLSRPISFQLAPASVDLYTPCPTEMWLRIFPSPVPAQTMFGSLAAIAREPIDCTGWSSKISDQCSTVAGFVNATGGGAGVVDPGVPGNADHGAEAIAFRADIPPAERVEYRGAEPGLRRLLCRGGYRDRGESQDNECDGGTQDNAHGRLRVVCWRAPKPSPGTVARRGIVGLVPQYIRWCEILKSITARTEAFR